MPSGGKLVPFVSFRGHWPGVWPGDSSISPAVRVERMAEDDAYCRPASPGRAD